jgi:endoglucanase
MSRKLVLCVLSIIFIITLLTACSGNATKDASSTPEITAATVAVDTTVPTATPSPTKVERVIGPTSAPVVTTRIVDEYGKLQVIGTNLCDEQGNPVQLKGMSTFGLNMVADGIISKETIQTLAEDWGSSVFRIAMDVDIGANNYLLEPELNYDIVCEAVDLCIAQGIYVIIDWHILDDGNPLQHIDESLDFFSRISEKYADSPNVLYEICNEPNSGAGNDPNAEVVTWADHVKPYAEQVVAVIRENDPDNVIIIGSPNWSTQVDVVSKDPVDGINLIYTVHFYAGTSGQGQRDVMDIAMANGIALFVTEWGTTFATGGGAVFIEESDAWIDYLDEHKISWCNWSIGSTSADKSNALKMYTDKILTRDQRNAGHWPDVYLTESGLYVRSRMLGIPYVPIA